MRVLHVEDEPDIAAVTALALETLGGWKLRTCSNGREALAALAESVPELILLDSMLPDMDGLQLIRELRKVPGCGAIPVIFITARALDKERAAMLQEGAIGIIAKPFDPMTLVGEIRATLERHRSGGPS